MTHKLQMTQRIIASELDLAQQRPNDKTEGVMSEIANQISIHSKTGIPQPTELLLAGSSMAVKIAKRQR